MSSGALWHSGVAGLREVFGSFLRFEPNEISPPWAAGEDE
jgi:hypothetical protein